MFHRAAPNHRTKQRIVRVLSPRDGKEGRRENRGEEKEISCHQQERDVTVVLGHGELDKDKTWVVLCPVIHFE